MKKTASQALNNLPKEILDQMRFIPALVYANSKKDFLRKKWNDPKYQSFATDAYHQAVQLCHGNETPFAAFDTCGHEKGVDYVLIDLDHVRDPGTGEFTHPDAEKWFNYLKDAFDGYYVELSQSRSGFHFLCRPTEGKFGTIKNSKGGNGLLSFSEDPKIQLEISYKTKNKACHLTGNIFGCEPNAPILNGEVADTVIEQLLQEIQRRSPKNKKADKPRADVGVGLPADIQELVDMERKLIGIDELKEKGYLKHSENGADEPNGFICLWCSSGTHAHKSGALTWYDDDDPHFVCHVCGEGGDVVKFLSKVYGAQDSGAELHFFALIRKIADDFNITYDPKIFERHAETRTQDKIKSCPVNLRVPRDFEFSLRGITYIEPPRKEGKPPRRIDVSLTPCVVTRNFVDPVTFKTRCEVAVFIRNKWRTLEFSARTIRDPRQVMELAEYGVDILEPKLLCKFFVELVTENPDIAEIKAYNQTGWIDDDCTEFASPNSEDYVIRREGIDYRKIFTPKGDADAWKQKFVKVMEYGGAPMRIMMGTAAASFLLAPLEISFNLRLHCWGQRSIGKTAAQSFCVSAFGDASKKGLIVPYGGSTPKGRYEIATAFNDIPLVGEEIESLQKRDAEKLSDEKYNFFSGTSGKVLHKEGGLRAPKYFRSAILTNGEHPASDATANGGELKREVSIHCPTLLPENFAADLYPFIAKNHGLFLDAWTQYIAKNKDFIAKQYHQALTLAQQVHSAADSTQLTMLVIAAVAYQHFKLCLKLTDLAADADAINAEMGSDIDDIVARLPTAAEIDDTTRAIEYLRDFVAANDKFFAHEVHKPEYDNEFTQQAMTCYGKIFKNGEVAFIPSELAKILETKFKSADKLIAEFADRGKLRTVHGLNTFQTKIKGNNVRAIRFVAGILTDAESDSDDDETTA